MIQFLSCRPAGSLLEILFGLLLLVVPEAVPTPAPCPLGLTDPSGTGEICLAGAGAIAFTSFPFALSWQQNMFQCQTLSQALFFKHIALEHEGACTAHLPKVSWAFIFPTILSMQVSEDIAKNLPMNGMEYA